MTLQKRQNIIKLQHLLTVDSLTNEEILSLIRRAIQYRKGASYRFLEPKFIANIFFEPSTHTYSSFEMAEHKLGIKVLSYTPPENHGNLHTLVNTIRSFSALGVDAVVVRSVENLEALVEDEVIRCSIINAGGIAELHPSQTLIDLMTIYDHFQRFNLKIGIIGPSGLTSVLLQNLLTLQKLGASIFCSEEAANFNNSFTILEQNELLKTMDVIYGLPALGDNISELDTHMCLANKELDELGEETIVLYASTFKRNSPIVDKTLLNKRSKLLHQMENAVFMRMAILEAILT